MTIDGAILTQFVTGTQVHVLEVISALNEFTDANIRVLVPPDLGEYASALLAQMPDVEQLTVDQAQVEGSVEPTDVVHRPYQILGPRDLDLLGRLGNRLVVTQQDLISYSNPGYHRSFKEWRRHRRLTRTSLARADHIVFFSGHAAQEALADEIVARRTSVVVPRDRPPARAGAPEPEMPRGADDLAGRPFLLCLGTDFRHKNRLFAIKLVEELRERGWDGMLAFAGAHVARGSSAGEEAAYLRPGPSSRRRCATSRRSTRPARRGCWTAARRSSTLGVRGLRPRPVRGGRCGRAVPVRVPDLAVRAVPVLARTPGPVGRRGELRSACCRC